MATLDLTMEEFGRWLGKLGRAPQAIDYTPPLRIAAVLLGAATKESFVGERDPLGRPWAPLKHERRRGGREHVLRDTGLLMASWGAGAHHVQRIEDRHELVWGTNLDRAWWHQHGTRRMVARPQAGITEKLAGKVMTVVGEETLKQLMAVRP